MPTPLFAGSLLMLTAAFAGGAWLMLTALRPRPGIGAYCAKCGRELINASDEFCPGCRRKLTDDMRVRCSQSAIRPGRFATGAVLVVCAAMLIVWIVRWSDVAPPDSQIGPQDRSSKPSRDRQGAGSARSAVFRRAVAHVGRDAMPFRLSMGR